VKDILELVRRKGDEFARLPFFGMLEGPASLDEVKALVEHLTAFVFGFQDILRLNGARIRDPRLKAMAETHRREDAGHELWFLRDSAKLEVKQEIAAVLGKRGRNTRDCTLELIAEVFRTDDDRERVLIPIVIDVAGEAFFSRVFRFFERAGVDAKLEYFSEAHWQIETGHELFDRADADYLEGIQLLPQERRAAVALVERMFAVMRRMVEHFLDRILEVRAAPVSPGALPIPGGTRE
jgi:hypothetical protein